MTTATVRAVDSWNLADLFERVADAVGDREAVVTTERRLTYAAFDARANQLAACDLTMALAASSGGTVG